MIGRLLGIRTDNGQALLSSVRVDPGKNNQVLHTHEFVDCTKTVCIHWSYLINIHWSVILRPNLVHPYYLIFHWDVFVQPIGWHNPCNVAAAVPWSLTRAMDVANWHSLSSQSVRGYCHLIPFCTTFTRHCPPYHKWESLVLFLCSKWLKNTGCWERYPWNRRQCKDHVDGLAHIYSFIEPG